MMHCKITRLFYNFFNSIHHRQLHLHTSFSVFLNSPLCSGSGFGARPDLFCKLLWAFRWRKLMTQAFIYRHYNSLWVTFPTTKAVVLHCKPTSNQYEASEVCLFIYVLLFIFIPLSQHQLMVPKIGDHGLFKASSTNSKNPETQQWGQYPLRIQRGQFPSCYFSSSLPGESFHSDLLCVWHPKEKKKSLVNRREHNWGRGINCLNSGFRLSHRSVEH